MQDRNGRMRPIRIAKPEGGAAAGALQSPVHAGPAGATSTAQAAPQDSERAERQQQSSTPPDKPDTATPTKSKPVPPSPGFTGFDTLGRKWKEGLHQEGEEEELDDWPPGVTARQQVRQAKHLHAKINTLASMEDIDTGAGKAKAKQLETSRELEAAADEALAQMRRATIDEDKMRFREENRKLQRRADMAYREAYKAAGDYKAAARKAILDLLALPPGESLSALLANESTLAAGNNKQTLKEGLDWINRIASNRDLTDAFPPFTAEARPEQTRPYYAIDRHTVVGVFADPAIAIHEFGHGLEEKMPGVKQLAQDFRNQRANGEMPSSYSKVVANVYDASEEGVKDTFALAFGETSGWYVGKWYDSGNTEIISMGVEKLYNDPVTFARKDPEYCCFILGVLDGTFRSKRKKEE